MIGRNRRNRTLIDQLLRELAADRRPLMVTMLWRARWEIGAIGAIVAALFVIPIEILLIATAILAAVAIVTPSLRRVVDNQIWCVVTQHRLRVGMRESDIRSRSGRLPAILWTSARSRGQRIILACPAGVDIEQIAAARSELAAACWASEIDCERHARYSHIVVVHVTRLPRPGGKPT